MFCEKCGTQLSDTASFCNRCGNTVRKKENISKLSGIKINKKSRCMIAISVLVIFTGIILILGIDSMKTKKSTSTESGAEVLSKEPLEPVETVSIYGTWVDSSRTIYFTFQEDGRLRISGLEDTLGVDVLTFSEVDDNTLQLKAESENVIIGAIGIHMDYEISDDTMKVSLAGNTLKLVKKD